MSLWVNISISDMEDDPAKVAKVKLELSFPTELTPDLVAARALDFARDFVAPFSAPKALTSPDGSAEDATVIETDPRAT
jgi:hypothetical protein